MLCYVLVVAAAAAAATAATEFVLLVYSFTKCNAMIMSAVVSFLFSIFLPLLQRMKFAIAFVSTTSKSTDFFYLWRYSH
jgi:hypothetical protein